MVGINNSLGTDDLVDYMRMIERRLARLERGVQGNSGGPSPIITSLNITGLTLASQSTVVSGDNYQVMLRYSWDAVANDPSEYNKDGLAGYYTDWSLDGVHFTGQRFTTDTQIDVGPFAQNQSVTFRVYAQTIKGNRGNASTVTNTTTTDNTAPFQPSTPTVTPYLGQLAVDWNGLDVSSGQPPTDFRFCEVHISTTGATFTPTVATLVGTILRGGGTWIVTDLIYGTPYFARLVAVDTVGNRSPASTAGTGIPEQIVTLDLGANSVATANIQNLAVNNAKIADLAVGKLTAGTLSANVTVSGRIATSLTGARAEMNSAGFQAFNSSGSQTFSVAGSTGSLVAVGTFASGFAGGGAPYLRISDSGDRTSIELLNAAGNNGALINSPQDANGVSQLGMNSGSFTYMGVTAKHRLFLANGAGMALETFRTSNQTAIGGRVATTSVGAFLEMFNSTGNVQDGGYVSMVADAARVGVTNTGTTRAEIAMFDDETIWVTGQMSANNPIGGKAALFCGSWNVNVGGGTATVGYGATMASTPWPLMNLTQNTGSARDWHTLTATTTQFTFWGPSVAAEYTYMNQRLQ